MYLHLGLVSLFICVIAVSNEPVVRSNFGPVRGKWMNSVGGVTIAAYLGIPYAEPPTGPLRFKSPKPWEQHWMRIRNAIDDGPECIQMDEDEKVVGSEDCLTLNIFVPQIPGKRQLPVLVFIHGGAFISGSKNSTLYAPDYLLDQEILLVTVNYRLGILGFLSSGNEASPGNYGLKDIFEALKWIQANIEDFGGDPSSVTLAGHSSGAGLAHHLALSKRTEGLFDKLITHSGSANAPWAIHARSHAKIRYIALAIELGCTTNRKIIDLDYPMDEWQAHEGIIEEDMEIVECLRKANAEDITKLIEYFRVWKNTEPYINFGPTIEPENEDAIIIRHPMSTIENAEFRDIPWLTGVVADEGLIKSIPIFLESEVREELQENFEDVIPLFLETEEIVTNTTAFAVALDEFYFPDGTYNESNPEPFETNMTAMIGDGIFTYWVFEALNTQASQMNSSVFFYEFSYKGTFTCTFSYEVPRRFGVHHGDEINYLFPLLNNMFADWDLQNTANDVTMINIMTEMYSNFITKGIPSARLTPEWKPYQEDFRFMRLGMERSPDISMKGDFLPGRMEFWHNLMGNVCAPREELFPEPLTEDGGDHQQENATFVRSSTETICFSLRIISLLLSLHFIF